MADTFNFYDFRMGPRDDPPVSIVVPSTQSNALGSVIRLDGGQSFDPEGNTLTYTWSFVEVPIGSRVEEEGFSYLEDDHSVATFYPDKTGNYIVQLVVNDGVQDGQPSEANVNVLLSLVPVCRNEVPDASWMWNHLSDFWNHVIDKDYYETIWSAMLQAVASDILRLYQIDYNKTIKDIQDYYQRRWLAYLPRWDFGEDEMPYIVLGNQDQGDNADLGPLNIQGTGVPISGYELLVVSGAASAEYVGREVRVLNSATVPGNVGVYGIVGLGSEGASYRLSPVGTALVPGDEELYDAVDAETTSGGTRIDLPSATLLSLPIVPSVGDVAQVLDNNDSGYYLIEEVGDDYVEVNRPLKVTVTGRHVKLLNAFNFQVEAEETTFTDVVSVDLAQSFSDIELDDYADFDSLNISELRGVGTIIGANEILVPGGLVFDDVTGRTLEVLSGTNQGKYLVSGLNPNRTGYVCTRANFLKPYPEENVPFIIRGTRAAAGRIIIVGGKAFTILRTYNDSERLSPKTVAVVNRKSLPSGFSNVPWRVPATLVTTSDLEKLGVRAGDRLVFEVTRQDTGKSAEYATSVMGVDRNRLGFSLSVTEFGDTAAGAPTDDEMAALLIGLGVSGAVQQTDGSWEFVGESAIISETMARAEFSDKYFNSPLSPSIEINVGLFKVTIEPKYIIRNTLIPVDVDLASVPCMCDYIKEPELSLEGGIFQVLGTDELVELSDGPACFVENSDFVIESDEEIYGRDAVLTAGSTTVKLPYTDLLSRRVEVMDTLTVPYGSSAGEYTILNVLSEDEVTVAPTPAVDDVAAYYITRRVPGKFIRFYGHYTPQYPAPNRLWAENSFFDNSQAIEDNFGFMVSLTRENLKATDSVLPYKSAVAGLMYAWANGPTPDNVELGAQILLGLPYAESSGYILDVNDEYHTDPATGLPFVGRLLLEEVDSRGERTGVIKPYFYTPLVAERNPDTGNLDYFSDPNTTGLATNPSTGSTWAVGDFVEQFSILTKGVRVRDYVDDPTWFVRPTTTSINEVKKVHTFEIRTNTSLIDSADSPLVYAFARAIKPVWTDFLLVIAMWLLDTVDVEDDFSYLLPLALYDTPGFGVEACLRADNYNEASLFNVQMTGDSLMTRTLNQGNDLITEPADPPIVRRAGAGLLLPPPFDASYFFPIMPGDILYIIGGPNAGRYIIADYVDSGSGPYENRLKLSSDPDDFVGRDPRYFAAAENQSFQVLRRLDGRIIPIERTSVYFPTALWKVSTTSGLPAQVSFPPYGALGLFNLDLRGMGIAADDTLLLLSGADKGAYRVLRSVASGSPPVVNYDVLEIEPRDYPSGWPGLSDDTDIGFEVHREVLITNPIQVIDNADYSFDVDDCTIVYSADDLLASLVRVGDEVWANDLSGNPTPKFRIIDINRGPIGGPAILYVNPPPPVANIGDLYLVRPGHRWSSGIGLEKYTSDVAVSKVYRDLPEEFFELMIEMTDDEEPALQLDVGVTDGDGDGAIMTIPAGVAQVGPPTPIGLGIIPGDLVDEMDALPPAGNLVNTWTVIAVGAPLANNQFKVNGDPGGPRTINYFRFRRRRR